MTVSTGRPLADRLSEFAAGLRADAVPPSVRRAARWHLLDSLGVAIAGASAGEDSGRALAAAAAQWRHVDGAASVLGLGMRGRPELAALINGALMQSLEMDDKHAASLARPGSTVTPAVLAIAEAEGQSVGDSITAIVVGYEVMARLGLVGGKRFLSRGFHTSSLLGAFGAVAAVGNLRGLDGATIGHALGIVGTFAAGIQEATRTGATSKILHGGWGAHCGILALDLACAGVTGPASVFEGDYGFYATHLAPDHDDLAFTTASADLGRHWYLPETAYKPYPCCQLLHSFIEAAKTVRSELLDDGVDASTIEHVRAGLAEPGRSLVTLPVESKVLPTEPHEARFSLPFVVAWTLTHGQVDMTTFRTESLKDRQVQALAQRVQPVDDPESDYPVHDPAVLEVSAGGRVKRVRVPYHPGSPEAPLTELEVTGKFMNNASWLLGRSAADIASRITTIPENGTVEEMVALLVPSVEIEEEKR